MRILVKDEGRWWKAEVVTETRFSVWARYSYTRYNQPGTTWYTTVKRWKFRTKPLDSEQNT